MTRADIATAALSDQVEQRIRIAVSLLPAYRITARVRAWDGTRCDLLVTDLSDAYGRQAFELAKKRGTPVLAIGDRPPGIVPDYTIASASSPSQIFAQHMRELLKQHAFLEPVDPVAGGVLPALCRLAEPEYRGRPVDAVSNGRTIHIRPETGRVYAPTLSDLLAARDSFSSADWELQASTTTNRTHLSDGASRSLEAFLLQAAFQGRDQLPSFPQGRYQLKDWPDVGTAPEFIGALKVARSLLRTSASARDLQQSCMLGETEVKASLWAYRASNLLLDADSMDHEAQPPPPTALFSGMLARLASRFGLVRD